MLRLASDENFNGDIVRGLIRQTVASASDVEKELADFRRWFAAG